MATIVLNYAESNNPNFITRVVEVEEELFDENTVEEEKGTGSNGQPEVFVFQYKKDEA